MFVFPDTFVILLCSLGVSEKGQVILKLSVEDYPGHSSMPPKESTIGILARAVDR